MPSPPPPAKNIWRVNSYEEGSDDDPMYCVEDGCGDTICDVYTFEEAMRLARMGTAWEPMLSCLCEALALLDRHDVKTRQELALRQNIDRALALAGRTP